MRKIFVFIFATGYLFASNLLTYNIYERSDRVDIMLSFDAPYKGNIFQKKNNNTIKLTLNNLVYNKKLTKNINSKIVQEMKLEPLKNATVITLKSDKNIGVIASKTVNDFGLRIRVKNFVAANKNMQPLVGAKENKTPITTSGGGFEIDYRYYMVIFILIFLVIVLFILKRKMPKEGASTGQWLFKTQAAKEGGADILFQKRIDTSNSVVLLQFKQRKYLIVTGNSNLLLEKFSKDETVQKDDFEELFEQNRQKLNDFLKLKESELEEYKNKAGHEFDILSG